MKTTSKAVLGLICVGSLMAALPVSAANKTKPKNAAAAQPHPKRQALADEFSGQGYGMAGCGLGSIVFGDKPGMIQIVAATLNGTFGNQTFGITSGTSNCEDRNAGRTAALFITANRESLEKDIARGNGETVANLSRILGCQDAGRFGTRLQQDYGTIFPSGNTSTEKVVDSIMKIGATSCGQHA